MKERRMRMHLGKARNIGGAAGAIRLRAAIHQHKALSVKGLQERLFSQLFTGLVYPQIWEDPEVDLAALQIDANSRILTIASGGCNVMSYLSAGPARIHALDLNAAHVALGRLKLAAAASLPDQESFYRFFGDAADRRNIAAYDTYIRPHLDEASRAWWAPMPATPGWQCGARCTAGWHWTRPTTCGWGRTMSPLPGGVTTPTWPRCAA